MKQFIINLFSNRFGIVLAALNVCYLVSKGNNLTNQPLGKIFVCANFPAAISAILSVEFVKMFLHGLSFATETSLANVFFAVFVVLQSLFIVWLAKMIAGKLRPTRS